ncbi:MAG: tail fiber protein, partial [Prevotellaceae bacterium]|nr:tail fiber protein [Prevotellaceae bacterium]
ATDKITPGSVAVTVRLRDESLGVELDSDDLLDTVLSRWFNPICRERSVAVSETVEFAEYLCQMIEEIVETNITSGDSRVLGRGQDGKLYFSDDGILRLDDDGVIRQTNITVEAGSFSSAALGQDNKLYFCGYNGIPYLDDDGLIKQTNITAGYFTFAAMGQDGKLYFCGNSLGVLYLDDDGLIKQTNITTGGFSFAAMGQDNKLYFLGNGILRLDDDGQIRQTDITYSSFRSAALGQDNKLYFCGNNHGAFRLDDDGQIRQANIEFEYLYFAAMGQDGKLYFCGNNGILYLDDDGLIKWTSLTTGRFAFAAMGQDNKLYFCGIDRTGVRYLDDDGQIKQTNITSEAFSNAALGQDNKLYFGAMSYHRSNGIYRLDTTYSGIAFAGTATYKRYEGDELVEEATKSLLADVEPVLTESQYQMLNVSDVEIRGEKVIELFDIETTDFKIINNVTDVSAVCVDKEEEEEEEDDTVIGQIIDFAGIAGKWDEEKWTECDGATFNVVDYPELYDAIGREWTADSVPDGQFQVPDLRGRTNLGLDISKPVTPRDITTIGILPPTFDNNGRVGNIGGRAYYSLDITQMPEHVHTITRYTPDSGSNDRNYISGTRSAANAKTDSAPIGAAGGSWPVENRQPYAVVRKLIRYK